MTSRELEIPQPPDRHSVAEFCDKILARSPGQVALYLRNSDPARRVEVVDEIVRRTFSLRRTSLDAAVRLSRLALRLARQLPGSAAISSREVVAKAAGNLADLLRHKEKYSSADRLLRAAWRMVGGGTTWQLRGLLLEWQGALRRDQRRLPEAIANLEEARGIYQASSSHLELLRAEIGVGMAYFYANQPAVALRTFRSALRQSHHTQSVDLAFAALHNLIFCLEALGYYHVAMNELERCDAFYRSLATPSLATRASWLKGRLYCSLDHLPEAARHLEHVRAEFLAKNLFYDAALAGIDLALVYAKQKKLHLVYKLASEMLPVFEAQQVPREASAVLLLFAKTAELWRADALAVENFLATLAPIRRSSGR